MSPENPCGACRQISARICASLPGLYVKISQEGSLRGLNLAYRLVKTNLVGLWAAVRSAEKQRVNRMSTWRPIVFENHAASRPFGTLHSYLRLLEVMIFGDMVIRSQAFPHWQLAQIHNIGAPNACSQLNPGDDNCNRSFTLVGSVHPIQKIVREVADPESRATVHAFTEAVAEDNACTNVVIGAEHLQICNSPVTKCALRLLESARPAPPCQLSNCELTISTDPMHRLEQSTLLHVNRMLQPPQVARRRMFEA